MTLIRLSPWSRALSIASTTSARPTPRRIQSGADKEIFKFADSPRRHDRREADDPIVDYRNANAVLLDCFIGKLKCIGMSEQACSIACVGKRRPAKQVAKSRRIGLLRLPDTNGGHRHIVPEGVSVRECHPRRLSDQAHIDFSGADWMRSPVKTFNLNSDEWDGTRDREGWRVKGAFVGQRIGGELIGATMSEVEPGDKLWPYHTHHLNEEWVIVLRGEPTLRTPEGERVLKQGDVVCFRRGKDGAHQIINRTDSPIRVLMLSSMIGGESSSTSTPERFSPRTPRTKTSFSRGRDPRPSSGKARTSSGRRSRLTDAGVAVSHAPVLGNVS